MPEPGEGLPIQSNAEINKPSEAKFVRFAKAALTRLRFQRPSDTSERRAEYSQPPVTEIEENKSHEIPSFPEFVQAEEQLSPEELSDSLSDLHDLFKDKFDNSQIKQHLIDHRDFDRSVFSLHAEDLPYKRYDLNLSDGTSWGVIDPETWPYEYRIIRKIGDVSETIILPKDEGQYVEYEFRDVDSQNNPQRQNRLSKVRRSRNTQFAVDKAREIINSMPQIERS